MLGLLLASALASSSAAPTPVAVRIARAQADYRDCISDFVARQPGNADPDQALAEAIGACRDAEIALRSASRAAQNSSAADTLAIVLDTRLEGQEAGLRRRDAH